MINARTETVAEKNSFKSAFKSPILECPLPQMKSTFQTPHRKGEAVLMQP